MSDRLSYSSEVSWCHDDTVTRVSLNLSQGQEGESAKCSPLAVEERQKA